MAIHNPTTSAPRAAADADVPEEVLSKGLASVVADGVVVEDMDVDDEDAMVDVDSVVEGEEDTEVAVAVEEDADLVADAEKEELLLDDKVEEDPLIVPKPILLLSKSRTV